ncbi:hypothetical protein A5881_003943 [Enterococcus termitis]
MYRILEILIKLIDILRYPIYLIIIFLVIRFAVSEGINYSMLFSDVEKETYLNRLKKYIRNNFS